jgi:hypothetical protein
VGYFNELSTDLLEGGEANSPQDPKQEQVQDPRQEQVRACPSVDDPQRAVGVNIIGFRSAYTSLSGVEWLCITDVCMNLGNSYRFKIWV